MRRLMIIASMISALIGLPRLADKFRDPQDAKNTLAQPPSPSHIEPSLPEERLVQAIQVVQVFQGIPLTPLPAPMPVALTPSEPDKSQAAKLPLSDEDVIREIQRHLIRLGRYDGPVTDKWGRDVRAAARRFSRHAGLPHRHVKPTLELLQALKATDSDGLQQDSNETPERNQQFSATDISEPAEPSREYLPPWTRDDKSVGNVSAETAAIQPEQVEQTKPAAVINSEGSKHQKKKRYARVRKTVRYAARRSYRSYRPTFAQGGNFAWPFQ